jgi:hypothetical protein
MMFAMSAKFRGELLEQKACRRLVADGMQKKVASGVWLLVVSRVVTRR